MEGSTSVGLNHNGSLRLSRGLRPGEKGQPRLMWRGFVHRRWCGDGAVRETARLLHSVIDINHFRAKSKHFNELISCPKFNQMPQMPGIPAIRVCSAQVFHTVIHRFRGYPESVCTLN